MEKEKEKDQEKKKCDAFAARGRWRRVEQSAIVMP